MGTKPLSELTDLQLGILSVLWRHGDATATTVHRELVATTGLNRKTIGTLLARLETYGVLTHREDGREFVYRAIVSPDDVREAKARSVLQGVFEGNVSELVSYAMESGEVHPGDVERIRALIEEWERGQGRTGDPERSEP